MDDVTTPHAVPPRLLLQARLAALSALPALVAALAATAPLPGWARGALATVAVFALCRGAAGRGVRALAVERAARGSAEQRHAQETTELMRVALHDPLTGLPNRLLALDRLRHALSGASRRNGDVGVLFLDLDGFKAVNDTYGHAAGDQVLAVVASRLRATVRTGDTPARLAGDEFVVVCDDVDGPQGLRVAARRIEAALSAPMVLDGRTVCLGASVGAVLHDPASDGLPGQAASRLLARADEAMYAVKRDRHLRLREMGVLNRLAAEAALLLP